MSWTLIFAALAIWLGGWWLNTRLARRRGRLVGLAAPVLFGVTLLVLWELLVRGLGVPGAILPPPTAIGVAFASNTPTLWADFVQTFVKGALSGYVIGCAAGVLVAIAVDRSDFWKRGVMPVGSFVAALPIIGMAPIFVMWFGFGWQSKAAVVATMCFFPMLVNTVAGLAAADRMQADLMRTYAASPWQQLTKLKLPAAAPFIFNGLKICTTLALIGAIVAEFFGSPTLGMGFRISTQVGRLALDVVWAVILVAAIAGSTFYGVVTLLERAATFWHPSQRGR